MKKGKVNPELPDIEVKSVMSDRSAFSAGSAQELVQKNIQKTGSCRRILEHWRMILVIIVPIVAMIVFSSVNLSEAIQLKMATDSAITQINSAQLVASLIQMLQRERGRSTIYLSINRNMSEARNLLRIARQNTNNSFKNLPLGSKVFSVNNVECIKSDILSNINEMRDKVWEFTVTVSEVLDFYTCVNNVLMDEILSDIEVPEGKHLYSKLVVLMALLRHMDLVGIQRAKIGYLLTTCGFTDSEFLAYRYIEGKAKSYLDMVFAYDSSKKNSYKENGLNPDEYLQDVRQRVWSNSYFSVCMNQTEDERFAMSSEWFQNITQIIDLDFLVHHDSSKVLKENLSDIRSETEFRFALYISLQVFVSLSSFTLLAWYITCINKMTLRLAKYASNIKSKTKELAVEKRLTDKLLYRMLPMKIAMQLKSSGCAPAEEFSQASVYFSDIVDFTAMCCRCSPMQVIDLLNEIYSLFDDCIDKYDVYKVETIGDAYMVTSGIPVPNGNSHALHICNMSLDIRDNMAHFRSPIHAEDVIRIRIGIHSGPCVTGVVGRKMPRYCLFGDTVNTASRMESTGEGGRIQISSTTCEIISQYNTFQCTPRGKMEIKGKGEMMTYWLDTSNQKPIVTLVC
ncbi:uncharacterized protein LOC125647658 [Ostrea edulis]|uniref:uncharacterized protein LOC125647658 n=1 Tax=Ostrea edulis TaxID=37623 RepID=UPI0024AFD411|nr:uncharacterized protein LOC125647658 [Ostrea edulis]